MITVIAESKVKEGKMEQAINLLKEMVPIILESEPGTKVYIPHTLKGRENKNIIIYYEKYENMETFRLHMVNLSKFGTKLEQVFEPGVKLRTCYEIKI